MDHDSKSSGHTKIQDLTYQLMSGRKATNSPTAWPCSARTAKKKNCDLSGEIEYSDAAQDAGGMKKRRCRAACLLAKALWPKLASVCQRPFRPISVIGAGG
jgi:hypothetical protein